MVVLAQDVVDERDDDVYVACSRHGHVKETTMLAGKYQFGWGKNSATVATWHFHPSMWLLDLGPSF